MITLPPVAAINDLSSLMALMADPARAAAYLEELRTAAADLDRARSETQGGLAFAEWKAAEQNRLQELEADIIRQKARVDATVAEAETLKADLAARISKVDSILGA